MSRRALVSSRAETRSHATPGARFAYRHARLEMACAARIVPHAGARVDARALGSRGRLATMIRHPAPKSARRESRTRLAFEPVALIAPSHPSRASSRRRGSNLVAAALPETIFSVGTVAVLPLYGMMIGAPRAAVSRRVMSSSAPFAVMGCLYAAAFWCAVQSADARALWTAFTSACAGGVDVAAHVLTLVSGILGTAETAATAWLHLLSLDLFVARGVYLDAVANGVPAAHSLTLCCMFGPCGYLAHALTKALWRRR